MESSEAVLEQRASTPLTGRQRLTSVLGGVSGNFVEWFDWFAYVSFAIYFSGQIFPGGDQTTQLLQTYLPFALGFFARPVGAYLMGLVADHSGRRAALKLSIALMCVGSLAVGLTPAHATAGVFAPIILSIGRVVQGLSVGGEYGASATYVSEMSTHRRRGLWSGILYVTIIMGQLSAVLLLVLLQQVLTEDQLQQWGWRIPFFLGAALALVVYFIRSRIHESTSFVQSKAPATDRGKAMMLFTKYPRETAIIVALSAAGGSAFYFFTAYMKDFLVNSATGPNGDGFSKDAAAQITTGLLVCFMVFQPIVGLLSDWVGRKWLLGISLICLAALTYPVCTAILSSRSESEAFWLCLLPLPFLAGYTSLSAIIKAELFPAHVRAMGVALPYAVAQAVFGGNVGTAALALKASGQESSMFILLAIVIAVGGIVALAMRDSQKTSLIGET